MSGSGSGCRLEELPPPPPGKVGWPWTEAATELTEPGAHSAERITVVTPSFNQAHFLEETIRSVLLQGYPDLEYMVLDGGSTDGSRAIIERYSPWLTYWRSGPDHGQADAIVEGLQRASGSIFNWINSDDVLLPGALAEVNRLLQQADVGAGVCLNVAPDGTVEPAHSYGLDAHVMLSGSAAFHQPAIWLRRAALIQAGGIDSRMHYVFDWEMLVRVLARGARVAYTERPLVRFRLHADSKTVSAPVAFDRERRFAAVAIARQMPMGDLHKSASKLARTYRWWYVLGTLQRGRGSRMRRAWRVVRAALREPDVRVSRFTLGAIFNVMRSRNAG